MKHPSEILNDMMLEFQVISDELLKSNYIEVVQSEKALYGVMYATPSKRFARLLAVDREILVLFSNFDNQQVRTVNIAKETIEKSKGRLEPTVTIVVHNDSNGNNKLKIWGRGNGISILPIYVGSQFPKKENIEKNLCSELYAHDPFDITGPVSSDNQFYGRRTEAQDLARKLQSGQIKTCLGIRKIGKTSLLNRVIAEVKNFPDTKSIVIDCSKDMIWSMNAAQLMDSISNAVAKSLDSDCLNYSTISPSDTQNSISVCSERLQARLADSNITVIIFFDELDYITPSSPTNKNWITEFNIFWRNFRSVYQDLKRQNNNLGVFICGVSSKWFTVESIQDIENAALSFIPEEYLSPLSRGACIPMIKSLARTSGIQFSEDNSNLISETCSDMPFWIRKACSYIHRQIDTTDRPTEIDQQVLKSYLIDFIEEEGGILAQTALKHLFRVYPELEPIVIHIYNNSSEKFTKSQLSRLERYGLINTKPKLCVFGTMMSEGIKLIIESEESILQEDIFQAASNDSKNGTKFESVNEWADELAIINRGRNILEKKLRGLVVNFIRFDSISNKSKGPLIDRILKIVEEKERKKYKDLNAEQIIEKFLWSDLMKLMLKEWFLFEKVFIDKNEFTLNTSIINDRIDAHAKDAGLDDIALYKRAVNWFEEKLRINA